MFANIDKTVNITYNNIEYNIVTIMLYSCYNIIKIIDKLYFLKYVYKRYGGSLMSKQVDAIELAKYVIVKMAEKGKKINHLKLQKLLYYVQAWHLVYTNEPLISENFEAWLHGPVVRKVWDYYKKYSVMFDDLPCEEVDNIELTEEQKEIIDDVLDEYGDKTGYYLECLTHVEQPWKEARQQGENTPISLSTMIEYYSRLIDVEK